MRLCNVSIYKLVPTRYGFFKAFMVAVAGFSGLGASPWAQAAYPTKPLRVALPFRAGTTSDVIVQLWPERSTRLVGQPVVVDYRPRAGDTIAARQVASAPADGENLFWTVKSTMSKKPFLYKKLPYKAEDFVPITQILSVPFVPVVSPDSPSVCWQI